MIESAVRWPRRDRSCSRPDDGCRHDVAGVDVQNRRALAILTLCVPSLKGLTAPPTLTRRPARWPSDTFAPTVELRRRRIA